MSDRRENRHSVDPEEYLSGVMVTEVSKWIEPVAPGDPVSEMVCRLEEQVEDVFPVVDDDTLVGVVTGTDLAKTLKMPSTSSGLTATSVNELKKYLGHTARDLMTSDPMAVDEGETAWKAVELMVNHEFRNVPVTRGRKLQGVISMRDVLLRFERELKE